MKHLSAVMLASAAAVAALAYGISHIDRSQALAPLASETEAATSTAASTPAAATTPIASAEVLAAASDAGPAPGLLLSTRLNDQPTGAAAATPAEQEAAAQLVAARELRLPPGGAGQAAAVLTVTATRLQPLEMSRSVAADGSVAAWQEAVVGAESALGRLTQVHVQVGDAVRRGQVLATANTELAQAELAQLEAAAEEARAALAEASANAQRAREVQGSGALSPQQIGQYLTAERTAQARANAQAAAVQAQRVRIRNSAVRAPDDGIISARSATVGAVVPPGMELFRMIRQGRLEWRAEVDSTALSLVAPGMSARLTLPGGQTLTGEVRMVSPVVDAASRRGLVYVDLPPSTDARPGMFARGELQMGQGSAQTLPQAAVLLRDGFHWVFVIGADQRVQQVKVQVGRRSGDRIEITEGLSPSQPVVAGGVAFLSDGDAVRLAGAGTAS